jgi:hypothetical protein
LKAWQAGFAGEEKYLMKISISAPSDTEAYCSGESVERMLRIALTRYASLVRQVTMVWDAKAGPGTHRGYQVSLLVSFKQGPDMEIEEIQPRLELAIDRAIHRTDGVLRQYARWKAKSA